MSKSAWLRFIGLAALVMIVLGVNSAASASGSFAQAAKVKVFLSNNFMGNDWRVQMVNTAQAVAKKEPFASRFDFQVVNVENTPEAQSQSISNMIDQGAKAILIDASSSTALNAVIDRACQAGIIVISFDQIVSDACAYKIQSNIPKISNLQAEWIAKAIHGKGNIIMDRGLPGAPISKVLLDGWKAVFAKYPDIHDVCEFDGMYAEGPNEQGVTACLAANPQVDAVVGPSYCAATIRALKAANRPLVPTSCANFNGSFVALTEKGASGIILVNSPGLSALAMQTALDIMDGKTPPSKDMTIDTPVYATDTTIDIGVKLNPITIGTVAFPDLPPGLSFPVLPEGLPFTVTNDEAQGIEPGQATPAATMAPTQSAAAKEKVKVFLSNNFMGNDWRVQMVNTAQAVAKKEPFASRFDFQVVNVENTPEAQSQSISNMIDQGAKAILIDASSSTALNAVIDRACQAGIIVISFDQIVSDACAYKIQSNIPKISNLQAEWIAKAIHGKGNIIMDRGLPGAPISKVLLDGWKAVFAKYPDIHDVCEFDGMYAEGPNEQGVTACLAANPQVDAVVGPSYCAATIRALKAANRPLVPTSCANFNGSFVALTEKGASGIILVNSPGLSALAMQTALDIMDGKTPPSKDMTIDTPVYATDTTIDIGVKLNPITIGTVAFPDLPPGLSFPVLPEGLPFTVTNDEAQGK